MEYMMVNGYQIPALTLNEPPMPEIGKYGSLRRNFLRENAPMGKLLARGAGHLCGTYQPQLR